MPRVETTATRLLSRIPRSAVADGQKRLAAAQAEAASGRHADVGLTLGARTGSAISLRLQLDTVTSGLERAGQAKIRAGATQTALSSLGDMAKGFMSMLSGARTAQNGKALAATASLSALDASRPTLSTAYDDQYLFGGLNSAEAPLKAYDAGPRQAILDAFTTRFGFAPDNPAAAALTAADIGDFLDTDFEALFADPQWTTDWSNAATEAPLFRLSSGEGLNLSATANQHFARTLTKAFSMMEVLGNSAVSASAFQSAADRAMKLTAEAQMQLGAEQARIGAGEARLKEASASLEAAKGHMNTAIQSLEGVDPYEAATRVNLLMNQLEASYALTGRINRLSLLSYI
mgnify:CR=1 FL=1